MQGYHCHCSSGRLLSRQHSQIQCSPCHFHLQIGCAALCVKLVKLSPTERSDRVNIWKYALVDTATVAS